MIELFSTYSITTIIVIGFAIILAIKEIFEIIDFFKNKNKKVFDDKTLKNQETQTIMNRLDALNDKIEKMSSKQDSMQSIIQEQSEKIHELGESDKDQLRSLFVKEYHYFVEQKGWIDDFSLDALEKCYRHYVYWGGNSYVHDLIDEIKKLPHHKPLA